jgi:anthranilate phosphoribosyltransferase
VSALAPFLSELIAGRRLTRARAEEAMGCIMRGEATPAQIGSFLTALRMRGETEEEIAGFVHVLRENAVRVRPGRPDVLDTCGTGGDQCETFNISTAAAFVVAGAGVAVAKHGNRALSSRCGSADVLEALGVTTAIPPESVARCIDEVGIGFLFAPALHPAMKHAAGPRRELGFRTAFNLLGPLANPAGARQQVVGVFAEDVVRRVAGALARLDCERAIVVHGLCGMDEVSTVGPTRIAWVEGGSYKLRTLEPADFGLTEARIEDLAGGEPAESAEVLLRVLEGEPGPRRDVVLANAACALTVAGRAASLLEGMEQARASLESGAARERLEGLKRLTGEVAGA